MPASAIPYSFTLLCACADPMKDAANIAGEMPGFLIDQASSIHIRRCWVILHSNLPLPPAP
jgi:hypothetical protein